MIAGRAHWTSGRASVLLVALNPAAFGRSEAEAGQSRRAEWGSPIQRTPESNQRSHKATSSSVRLPLRMRSATTSRT